MQYMADFVVDSPTFFAPPVVLYPTVAQTVEIIAPNKNPLKILI